MVISFIMGVTFTILSVLWLRIFVGGMIDGHLFVRGQA